MRRTTLLLVTFLAAFALLLSACQSEPVISENHEELLALATCLEESGAKMYGAYTCYYCETQKEQFGSAQDALPYIECSQEQELCAAAGVQAYPTWIFADGSRTTGVQTFTTLAAKTDCVWESG